MAAYTSVDSNPPLPMHTQHDLRSVIRFFNSRGETPIRIHRKLTETFGTSCMSAKNVRKWCRQFSAGRTEIRDERRSGRPSLSNEVKEHIVSAIREDPRLTVRDLERRLELSKSTTQRLLNELGYRKLGARWVPKMLTEDLSVNSCVKSVCGRTVSGPKHSPHAKMDEDDDNSQIVEIKEEEIEIKEEPVDIKEDEIVENYPEDLIAEELVEVSYDDAAVKDLGGLANKPVDAKVANAVGREVKKEFQAVVTEVFIKEEPREDPEEFVAGQNEVFIKTEPEEKSEEFVTVQNEVYIVPDRVLEDGCITQEKDPLEIELPQRKDLTREVEEARTQKRRESSKNKRKSISEKKGGCGEGNAGSGRKKKKDTAAKRPPPKKKVETPEEREDRLRRKRENARKRRLMAQELGIKKQLTPEELEARRERRRRIWLNKLAKESEEERAIRLSKNAQCARNRRQHETEEEHQRRLEQIRMRKLRERANETPEEREAREERAREYQRQRLLNESEERRKERLRLVRKYQRNRLAHETYEEREDRLMRKKLSKLKHQ